MRAKQTEAGAVVIFGITGDLARKMTLPALYRLEQREMLGCSVVGIGSRDQSREGLIRMAREAIEDERIVVDEGVLARLASRLTYLRGDIGDPELYERLQKEIAGCGLPLFYLAVPPDLFEPVVQQLGASGLASGARIAIEKPFGHDLASAQELNRVVHGVAGEDQVFRIDHFLGKEPVQDILYLRFANEIFEPVWNRKHVESVQVVMAEAGDVISRGRFYDPVGCLRDVVQNHLLQVLALVAMEPPAGGMGAIADRRLDVLRAMPDADPARFIRGQYEGYLDTPGVLPASTTETFCALRLEIENWRWSGVPFFIAAGKAMAETFTEVRIRFRKPPDILMGQEKGRVDHHNHLVIRIGADAGADIGILAKASGHNRAEQIHLDVSFEGQVAGGPTPYERLLADAMAGDHTLFPREDVVEETWRIVQPLLDSPPDIHRYVPGTWGPAEAEAMLRSHGGLRSGDHD